MAYVHAPDLSGTIVIIMRVPLSGTLHGCAVSAIVFALFAIAFDVRAQSTAETRVFLDRIEVVDSIAFVHYTVGSEAHVAPLETEVLLGLVLEPPDEADVTPVTRSVSDILHYKDDSSVNGHKFDIKIEKGGFATFADLTDGAVFSIPTDVVQYAGDLSDYSFLETASLITSLRYNTGTRAIDFLVQNTVPLATAIILLVLILSGAIFWMIYRSRRERKTMLDSRRRLVLVRESERTKLAADLHDGPIQELQLLLRTFSGQSPRNRHNGRVTQRILRTLSDELRDICADLRPPVLHHFGFPRAARTCTTKFREHFPSVNMNVSIEEFEDLMSDEQRITLYRALQETLMNVGRHAEAQNVWVDVIRTDNEFVLSVKDDGRGFHLPKRLSDLEEEGHLGLSFLSQRVEAIGARLSITSAPGEGTKVRVVMPLKIAHQRGVAMKAYTSTS